MVRGLTFIRPDNNTEYHLLLGLPWLFNVGAVIDIPGSTICIRDRERGETHTRITGPTFQLLNAYKLILVPTAAKYQEEVASINQRALEPTLFESSDQP